MHRWINDFVIARCAWLALLVRVVVVVLIIHHWVAKMFDATHADVSVVCPCSHVL